jgi:hypothetical protein
MWKLEPRPFVYGLHNLAVAVGDNSSAPGITSFDFSSFIYQMLVTLL